MFTIVVGTDEFGSIPLLLREEDALPGGALRWRLVAQTADARRSVAWWSSTADAEPPSLA
jgi:hypothetical protein